MLEQREYNEDDLNMIRYFWEEKGDIFRYASFEDIEVSVRRDFPQLFEAWDNYLKSIENLNNICKDFYIEY